MKPWELQNGADESQTLALIPTLTPTEGSRERQGLVFGFGF